MSNSENHQKCGASKDQSKEINIFLDPRAMRNL